jgi:hypothetical protein
MKYYYNDENTFKTSIQDIEDNLKGHYVSIPIYYGLMDDGTVILDIESMKEEFERTVSGIEITLDSLQEKV